MIARIPAWLRVIIFLFGIWGLIEYYVDSGEQPALVKYPEVGLILALVLFILIALELVLNAIEKMMFTSLTPEAQERYLAAKKQGSRWGFGSRIYKRLTKGRSIEEEGEIVLDHNYDGIRELDNVLPPWWVYMFYATIIFAVVYLVRFHVVGDYTQTEEFEQQMAEARLEVEEYKRTAKNLVDASTVTRLTDAGDLAAGKKVFEANCVACHMADGGGGIGPNLTDKHWILGGGIKNIFNTISEGGRDGKGMVAWKNSLKPLEMAQVASYIMTMEGTTPANPKAAEGEIWEDPEAPEEAAPEDPAAEEAELVLETEEEQ